MLSARVLPSSSQHSPSSAMGNAASTQSRPLVASLRPAPLTWPPLPHAHTQAHHVHTQQGKNAANTVSTNAVAAASTTPATTVVAGTPAAAATSSATPTVRATCACSHLHPHKSCLSYLVSSFGRSFYLAYGIRAGISLALHIIKLLRTRPSAVFQIDQLVGAHGLPADAVRMGLFLGGFTGIYNGMRCLLARWSGRDDVSTVMVSGAVAGLALNFHPKDSHRTLALYVLARVFQCWYNKAKVMRPDTLPPAYYKFIVDTGPIVRPVLEACRANNRALPIDLDSLQTAVTKLAPKKDVRAILGELAARAYGPGASATLPPIVPCSILHAGQDVCALQWKKTFVDAAKRSFPLYVAVTFVPMIVLRFWAVVRHPIDSLLRGSLSVAKSTTFLSSFVTLYMFTCCMQRRIFARDHRIVFWLAGFLSSWTILLEQKSRRSELALYVFPRCVDSLVQTLHDRRLLSRIPYAEQLLFSAGMAALMYYREFAPASMSPLLRRLLNFFVPTYKSMPKEHVHNDVVAPAVAGAPCVVAPPADMCAPSPAAPGLLQRADSDGLSSCSIDGVIPLPQPGISLSREQSLSQLHSNPMSSLPSFVANNSAALPVCEEDCAETSDHSSSGTPAKQPQTSTVSQERRSSPPQPAASYNNLFARDVSPGVLSSPSLPPYRRSTSGSSSGSAASSASSSSATPAAPSQPQQQLESQLPPGPSSSPVPPVEQLVQVVGQANGKRQQQRENGDGDVAASAAMTAPSPSPLQEPSPPSGATIEPASAPPALPSLPHERRGSADGEKQHADAAAEASAANGNGAVVAGAAGGAGGGGHGTGHGKKKKGGRR